MATYAAKTGTQNFTDTWATVNDASANITEGSATSHTATTTSYVASTSFTPGAITIDGMAAYISYTTMNTASSSGAVAASGTFSVRLAQAGTLVAGTEITVNVSDIHPYCPNVGQFGLSGGEITNKIGGGWVFFKFPSTVTLLAATAYTLDVKSSVASQVYVGTSSGSNWLRYLRTTSTGTPAASDRLFICGEMSSAGVYSTNTVNHDLTSSTTTYGRVDVGAYGDWIWNTSASTNYYFKTNGDIRLGTLGKLQIGSSGTPLPSTSTATIDFVSTSGGGLHLACSRRSTITMYGPSKTHLGYLQSNIAAGVSTATVSASSTSLVDPAWKSGDLCTFSAYPVATSYGSDYFKTDEVTLNSNSSSGVLTWSQSRNYLNSTQATTYYAHQTYHPWVVNLTRNIVIKGASTTNTFYFGVNTDQIDINSVEMYNIDALDVKNSDGKTRGNIKNCVVRECRSVSSSTSGIGGGINLRGCTNLVVEDCIVSKGGSGIQAAGQPSGSTKLINHVPVLVKGCVSINNHGSAIILCLGIAGDAFAFFENCISTSNNALVRVLYNTRLERNEVFKNCHIGINNQSPSFVGAETFGDTGASGNRFSAGDGRQTINGCTFYANPVTVSQSSISFVNCTFKKPASSASDYFIQNNTASETQLGTFYPTIFENCTFDMAVANTANDFFAPSRNGYYIFNGGSTNCSTPTLSAQRGLKIIFNNFSCPNWNLTTTNNATTDAAPTLSSLSNGRDSFWKFQRFNQVEGDHRVYSGMYNSFSDSTIVDSSPRSLKVYSALNTTGALLNPMRIPLKKNQSATVTVKVKLSEPRATYNSGYQSKAFTGKVPSLFIRANRALGANYNSDVELVNAEAFNGAPSVAGFAPTSLGSNCKLWCSAMSLSDITYDSTTKTVSQWTDKSGSGNHLVQATESKKPQIMLTANSHGGYPINFANRADQRLVCASNILGTSTAEMEIFMVVAPRFTNYQYTNSDVFGFAGGASPLIGYLSSSNGAHAAIVSGTAKTTNSNWIGDYGAGEKNLFESCLSQMHIRNSVANSQRRVFVSGLRAGSNSSGNQDATAVNVTPTEFALGVITESSGGTISYSAPMDFFEIVVVNRRMTDTEVDDMNKYLCNKWNLALRLATTTWKTLTFNIPAVTDDTVVEANLMIKGQIGPSSTPMGWINIDTITVT